MLVLNMSCFLIVLNGVWKFNLEVIMKIGFMGLLALLFIGLKLTGFINWSWWLVLLPLYGGFALWIILAAIMLAAGGSVVVKNSKR